ncbi:universal stress protein [Sphingobacterium corticibacter]|uniref:UspA domain-containing protein n=1 Tax=Sphingobacterium corticibacter TaxID=2171749 RepID=A0A2T8HH92_9SPHI|nr:universal stress protein [Sphingobacterium corticibacter]PVH24692.1 hypothetical protein DC487_11190 [Sphingobacterium corticibacter]
MANTILVPVDYSENALSAAHYACSLAKLLNCNIELLHAYQPFTSSFQSPLANQTDKQRAAIGAEKGMSEFLGKLKLDKGNNLEIQSTLFEGPLLESVEHACKTDQISLIVMGTHGASGIRADLIGSNTYHVAKSVVKPLIVVPHNYIMNGSLNAVFFSDFHKDDKYTGNVFAKIFKEYFSKISLIHILSKEQIADQTAAKLESWHSVLKPILQMQLENAIVDQPETIETVNRILEQSSADMCLLTLAHDRNFFENLFQKSLAKAIILNPRCPVFLAGKMV